MLNSVDELKELANRRVIKEILEIEEGVKNSYLYKKVDKKHYTPRKERIVALAEINTSAKEFPMQISCMNGNSTSNDVLEKVIKEHIKKFTNNQIQKMSDETKNQVLDASLIGMMKTFRHYRKGFLSRDMMFAEDYENEKLKYIMTYGYEAKVVSEEVYIQLEEYTRDYLREALKYYLQISEGDNKKRYGLFTNTVSRLKMDYFINCLKIFSECHFYYLDQIGAEFEKKMVSDEENAWIAEYGKLKECPLTHRIEWSKVKRNELSDITFVYRMEVLTKDMDKTKKVLFPDKFDKMIREYISFIKDVSLSLEEKRLDEIVSKSLVDKTVTLIQRLPKVIENIIESK